MKGLCGDEVTTFSGFYLNFIFCLFSKKFPEKGSHCSPPYWLTQKCFTKPSPNVHNSITVPNMVPTLRPFSKGTALENGFIPVARQISAEQKQPTGTGQRRCAVQSILDCGLWFCYEKSGDGESTILRAYFSYDNSNMP